MPSKNLNNRSAHEWRNSLMADSLRFRSLEKPDEDRDIQFEAFLTETYALHKTWLATLSLYGRKVFRDHRVFEFMVAREHSVEEIFRVIHSGLFSCAIGLFTYGQLQVVPEIIENLPPPNVRFRVYARCLFLLPLPDGIDPLSDARAFLIWFDENLHRLRWDGEKSGTSSNRCFGLTT